MKLPNRFKQKHPNMNRDIYVIPTDKYKLIEMVCIASDGFGWDHVSISMRKRGKVLKRCPTWEEMCQVKRIFWTEDETVIQIHPPKSEYVNVHNYCLHLWKPHGINIPLPLQIMV